MPISWNPHRKGVHGLVLIVMVALGLSACTTVGPDYYAPRIDLPARWSGTQGNASNADLARLRTWWREFNDPMLNRLVDLALRNNQDLGVAQERLRQARAERVQIAAGLGPTVLAGGAGQALRGSKLLEGASGGQSQSWALGFDASWELDLFGGTRRAVEAADAGVDALVDDHRALQVSLLAELAADYAELRARQLRLNIARDNVRTLREVEQLAERALRRGLGASADVMQARAEREMAQAQPPVLDADIVRLSHAIGVLAGGFPGDWRAALAEPSPILPVVPALPLALSSEIILQRPDLQADERRLAAATAQIGVAEATQLPHFSIPLGVGTTAAMLHELFSGASLAWSASVQASQVLYDGGRAGAGVRAAQAHAQASRLIYERDVRLALRDVEDALTGLSSERQRQRSLTAAVQDSQQALDRASRLYRKGLSGYLSVLTAQRTVNQARDTLAVSQWGEVQGVITLYKALGAGWQNEPSVR